MTKLHDFTADTISGSQDVFDRLAGQVVLIVNTASECGFTPQYDGLEKLYEDYKDRGFTVLGFPCNQFGDQEPGDGDEIQAFCRSTYGVEFPLYKKVDVNGLHTHPLWAWLKSEKPGENGADIEWNFTKFLVDKSGTVVARFGPSTEPEELRAPIEESLQA
ncbi:glutathione peroxidase [Kocuria coralli]|uniref:Glutathione peroxidase n=1 Tax=Kocuria coralli TaxID=1461025 RepID=A0A5J5KWD9_9MICC|nr:glutathione peroxidase [Kocuria coralli]KAA9393959.1 glutathione peroxidase [Kocuria coralli]